MGSGRTERRDERRRRRSHHHHRRSSSVGLSSEMGERSGKRGRRRSPVVGRADYSRYARSTMTTMGDLHERRPRRTEYSDRFSTIPKVLLEEGGRRGWRSRRSLEVGSRRRSSDRTTVWFSLGLLYSPSWYSFKLSSSNANDGCARDPTIYLCCGHQINSVVADDHTGVIDPGWGLLGRHLYRLGGHILGKDDFAFSPECPNPVPLNSVRAIDLERPEEGWKHKPCMLARRLGPRTHAGGGKLYAFGGQEEPWDPWGEVFDPRTHKWTALPDPPPDPTNWPAFGTYIWAGLKDDGSFLVLPTHHRKLKPRKLVVYDAPTNSWKEYHIPLHHLYDHISHDRSGPVVAVGSVLYWPNLDIDSQAASANLNLLGYDWHHQILYQTSRPLNLISFAPPFVNYRTLGVPMLTHLRGNTFCLLFRSKHDNNADSVSDYCCRQLDGYEECSSNLQHLHCLKFSVALATSPPELVLTIHSSQSFKIRRGNVENCFLL
ncbi:hypothetical protein Tsubulata_018941 [Turnera subulata]|uniref:Uncharacterized protein n=1 Tax=Turnera subulata TaxID=218843 RepID=A0A9Q0FJ55_9ROSI|nr:hypothetical protein Tsubulata_018941 [Turnera subulata]